MWHLFRWLESEYGHLSERPFRNIITLMPPICLVCAGAAFDLIGAVIAVISHRRVKTLKALDLRIEVRRLRNDAHVAIAGLADHFDKAVASRRAIANAIGKSGSGDMEWDNNQRNQLREDRRANPPDRRSSSRPSVIWRRYSLAALGS
jgi:hypothetical protein